MLVDAPNTKHRAFQTLCDSDLNHFERNTGLFSGLDALIFTHIHPDHCDLKKAKEYIRLHPACQSWVPDYDKPKYKKERIGDPTVELDYLPHMDVPEGMVMHYVVLVTCGTHLIYISSDGSADPSLHAEVLNGRRPDIAFWNPFYYFDSNHEMREWIMELGVRNNYIYHLPVDSEDVTGIRRKCAASLMRCPEAGKKCVMLTDYPSVIRVM